MWKKFSKSFITDTGIPQGDSLSPVLFTLYLAKSLKGLNNNSSDISHLSDHNYHEQDNLLIDQQYADDAGWVGDSDNKLNEIETNATQSLQNRDLVVNISKTEKYNISSKSGDDWKQCKYLGSYLDTDSDIFRRKQLSYAAFNHISSKLN